MNLKRVSTLLLVMAIAAIFTTANAQIYKNALGLRISGVSSLGGPGVTYKHYLSESKAIEGIFSFKNPAGLGAMYQVHQPWSILPNLNWFYGGGGFVTFGKDGTGVGAMGIIGTDYKFENLPLNIALDWKPEVAFAPKVALNFNTFALSLRVTLDKKQ